MSRGGNRGEEVSLLHNVVAAGVVAKEPMTTLGSVNLEWFSTRMKQLFVDNGIRASFVGTSMATWLVVEDSAVEELKEVLNHREPEWRAADAIDESDRTLLDLVVGQGHANNVQVLLEYGVDAYWIHTCTTCSAFISLGLGSQFNMLQWICGHQDIVVVAQYLFTAMDLYAAETWTIGLINFSTSKT